MLTQGVSPGDSVSVRGMRRPARSTLVRAGEAARIVALNQRAGTSRAEAAGTVVLERAADILSLLVLLFVALPWFPPVRGLRAAAIVGIVLVLALAAVIVVLARHGERP